MQLARRVVAGPDGRAKRLLARRDSTAEWVDLRTAFRLRSIGRGASPERAAVMAAALAPSSTSQALQNGADFHEAVVQVLDETPEGSVVNNPELTNALDPTSYRDFMVFEKHFSFGYRWQNKPVPEVIYELPVSYAGDPLSFIGPGETIPWPSYSQRLDYELELGIVIGRAGTNLRPEQALDHVLGLMIFNDVSARDIQVREMAGGLGPSKGKHFACVAGPVITTLDEIPDSGLAMTARVNGEVWCATSSAEMAWSVAEIVAWASQGELLRPGALLGSGTCNGGSTIEIDRCLKPGDELELEIECLGLMRNRVGTPGESGWTPEPRDRSPGGAPTRFLT
jgi:2-keto-4-pentenoate hydratase/2-oxohepta-3-ene-1,7-dioic acid hydratase in catechol pathway